MPGKAKQKKPKKLKPFEKCQEFLDGYKKLCKQYDIEPLELIDTTYSELIAKGKACRKLPQFIQFADEEVTATQLRPLIECLQAFDVKPKFLSFLNTNSGDEGFHVVATSLIPPLEIQGISFINENIGPSGCRAFGRGLAASKSLCVLELDFNHGIGDEGVRGLINHGHCPTLIRLSLKYCSIGDKGLESLGKWLALPECKIEDLDISGNDFTPAGVTVFASFLSKNKSLQKIDLSNNIFANNPEALEALKDGIAGCPTLTSVIMTNNFECPDGIDEKYLDLVTNKPLGDFEFTHKMDSIVFQNARAAAMANKKKIAKDSKKKKTKKPDGEEEEEGSEREQSEKDESEKEGDAKE